ncbi:MAG: glutamyl-tRNA reductase [Polyangiaceae bacterium]|jgi:glutamyl-tRNA reductase|nr:glutamyl-tRNA reductase [Polyangiaceae bacterium]
MMVVVGLSHKTAPIAVRERVAIPTDRLGPLLHDLAGRPEIAEAMVLSTCNRVEVYVATELRDDGDGSRAALAAEEVLALAAGHEVGALLHQHLFHYAGDAAIRHMFRVSASLDSLVVGEAQVLGQMKAAFDAAVEAATVGPVLSHATNWAFRLAKRVRNETSVGAGSVSVSSIAVELAHQILGDLHGRIVALLGVGTMGEAAAKHLCGAGANLLVVNRNVEKGTSVANRFQGQARPWTQLEQSCIEADVIVASTASPTFVITPELLARLRRPRRGRSLFVIDISVPRNVDPRVHDIDGVYLYDIDDLSSIASEAMRERQQEAQRAERIVAEEAEAYERWLDSLQVTPTIVAFRHQVHEVLEHELERSLRGKLKHLDERDRKALRDMIAAATNKLTHQPTTRLKTAAAEAGASDLVEVLRHLFDLGKPTPESDGHIAGCRSSSPPRCRRSSSPPPKTLVETTVSNGSGATPSREEAS